MDYIRENIRYLRRLQGLTQEELSDTLNIKRSQLGAYEETQGKTQLRGIGEYG
jgi:transcriptional regulator with XRE-family HTH domain